MAVVGLIWCGLVFVWAQYLPGYLVSRWLVPDARGVERQALALVCAFSPAPLVLFLASVGAGVPMDATLILIGATAVNVGLGWWLWSTGRLGRDTGWRDAGLVAALGLGFALLLSFGVRSLDGGDVFATVHHCLYVIAMYAIANDPFGSVPMYDAVSGDLMHYLVQHRTSEFNGLAALFYEQRIGNAPLVGPPVALYGTIGWLGSSVLAAVVTTLCCHQAARRLGVGQAASWLAALLFAAGMQVFCGYFINENTFAVALVAFLAWFVLIERPGRGWLVLAGIVAGHLIGVRYTSSLFWPVLVGAVLWRPGPWGARVRALATWGVAAAAAVAPWLYINVIMLGNPLAHPKVHSDFAARMVVNELLGIRFRFRALNWPFTDGVVRTAWNPFPTFLWLPLQVGRVFGQVTVALALVGWVSVRTVPRALALLLGLALPHTLAISLLETLDWEQLTYAAPGLVPMAVALAVGLDRLVRPATRGRALVGVAVALAAVVGGSLALRGLEFEVDTRRERAVGCVLPTGDDPGVERLRETLTAPALLPMAPVPRAGYAANAWASLAHVVPWAGRIERVDGLPVYPSGQAAILSAYSATVPRRYDFYVDGGPLRTAETPVRTSLGLHQIALRLPAERVKFEIERRGDDGGDLYEVKAVIETPSAQERDFTVWVHPWNPPVRDISGRIDGASGERAVQLAYGTDEPGERRFILTNYPPEIIDIMELEVHVDAGQEPLHWGLLLFLADVDPERIETLILTGGHDQAWTSEYGDRAVLRVPRNVRADTMVLYVDPYCSDHVPQYGDRYGLVRGPFDRPGRIELKIDQQW